MSAVTKKKLTPAWKAASTVSGDRTIPRQYGLTRRPRSPRISRSVNCGKLDRRGLRVFIATSRSFGLRYNEKASLRARRPGVREMPGRCGLRLPAEPHRPFVSSVFRPLSAGDDQARLADLWFLRRRFFGRLQLG